MSRAGELASAHRALVLVLVAGLVLRLMAMVAYGPALFFSDSWAYVHSAWDGTLVRVEWDRPAGYAMAIKLFGLGTHTLWPLVAVQHLAGLATGALVYAFLVRRDVPRRAAVPACAVVVLDANLIGVSQHVLPEAFFVLLLTCALLLTAERPRDPRALAIAGLLLAVATLMRSAGVFVVVAWLAYLAISRVGWRRAALGAACALVPLALYAGVMAKRWDSPGLSAANGFFLYGRVAELARCEGLDLETAPQRLCEETETAQGPDRGPGYFLWDPASPARRLYPQIGQDVAAHNAADRDLGALARAVIADRPAAYAEAVARDFVRYFEPGAESLGGSDTALSLPEDPLTDPPDFHADFRDEYLPGYEPPARAPAVFLARYQDLFGTPRVGLALLLLAALAGAVAARGRRRLEILLLGGAGVALLVGSVLTSGFIVRYLLPAVPLLLCAGALGATYFSRNALMRSSKRPVSREYTP